MRAFRILFSCLSALWIRTCFIVPFLPQSKSVDPYSEHRFYSSSFIEISDFLIEFLCVQGHIRGIFIYSFSSLCCHCKLFNVHCLILILLHIVAVVLDNARSRSAVHVNTRIELFKEKSTENENLTNIFSSKIFFPSPEFTRHGDSSFRVS